jgi:7-cyano-7-deazaguanine synthase
MKSALVLLSGGIDSATTLAIARDEGYRIYALTFNYGQRHEKELDSARLIAQKMHVVEHLIIDLDLKKIGGSALTDSIDVPKGRSHGQMMQEIPVTYVPARNTVFLSIALAWAEVTGADDIFIGVNAIDYSGYPDCRPEFLKAFEKMANLATKAAVEENRHFTIMSPLINLTKSEIIKTGSEKGLDYGLTWSCYDPIEDLPCGRCDSCILRKKGFLEAGLIDPLSGKQ